MTLLNNYKFTVADRFLKYVTIDTQSDPTSCTQPSTMKQKVLGKILADELRELGLEAELDEFGYVYATIRANTRKSVPVICFCSHMDTSPDSSGANVKPLIHRNYQGKDITLPDDPAQIIREMDHPDLRHQYGNDIITASGTTLLGADDKAGLAEIMDAATFFTKNQQVMHGDIRILFTPDEEIGRGVDKADLKKLAADYAYTIDGETVGSIENETFSADAAVITVKGVSAHPGFAKGKLESAIKIASEMVAALPAELSPENTRAREGFIHPIAIKGSVEQATIDLIIRDFDENELANYATFLKEIADKVIKKYPSSSIDIKFTEQYRNMKHVLDAHPKVVEYGKRAIERAGLTPKLQSIRGGTDGSKLSLMGLPCPNIFAGGHAFHGKQEWVSIQDMKKAVETIINIALVWEEES